MYPKGERAHPPLAMYCPTWAFRCCSPSHRGGVPWEAGGETPPVGRGVMVVVVMVMVVVVVTMKMVWWWWWWW